MPPTGTITSRRGFLTKITKAATALFAAVVGISRLEAQGCEFYPPDCCFCHPPMSMEQCVEECTNNNGCFWSWSLCMECFTDQYELCNYPNSCEEDPFFLYWCNWVHCSCFAAS